MKARAVSTRRSVAAVTICSLLVAPGSLGVLRAAFPNGPAAPTQGAAAKPSTASAAPADGGWPRSYITTAGARLIVYQPQVASWPNQAHMTLYSAVSYTPAGAAKPALGTLKVVADTRVAVAERLVDFSAFKITESNFPTLNKAQLQDVVSAQSGCRGAQRGHATHERRRGDAQRRFREFRQLSGERWRRSPEVRRWPL
jgi:hypothetical protein